MQNVMFSIDEVRAMLARGKRLLLAGEEDLLAQVPKGPWVGGTIPYFIAENGGVESRNRIFVTEVPSDVTDVSIHVYDENSIDKIYTDAASFALAFAIIPATCKTHLAFALHAPTFKDFATRPLVGWIAGVHLSELGKRTPKVFDGERGRAVENGAVVMFMRLPKNKVADIGICNLFAQGDGDVISFTESSFLVSEAIVNGKRVNFAEYLSKSGIDTRLPLVADYYGAMVNCSFQEVNVAQGVVHLYSPVFSGIQYKIARPIRDYSQEFVALEPSSNENVMFSCNCILNYLYSGLEGKKTGSFTGPATFGEIAYQLLNQTMVYIKIEDAA